MAHEVPIEKKVLVATFNNRAIGVAFKKEQAVVKAYLKTLGEEDLEACQKLIDAMAANGSAEVGPLDNGKTYTITPRPGELQARRAEDPTRRSSSPRWWSPPSAWAASSTRSWSTPSTCAEGEEKRTVMAFKPAVAAIKCSIMPINNSEQFNPTVEKIGEALRYYALAFKTDASSASIGRRYARTDEIGVPFAITVDFETLNEKSELFNTVDAARARLHEADPHSHRGAGLHAE